MEKKIGYLEGENGEKSSKRLCGMVLIGTGIAIGITAAIMSLFHVIADPVTVKTMVETFIASGAVLLGASAVIEKFRKSS